MDNADLIRVFDTHLDNARYALVGLGNHTLARDFLRQATRMLEAHPHLNRDGSDTRAAWLRTVDAVNAARPLRLIGGAA